MFRSFFDSGHRPLWVVKGYPVYLATVLTAAHVAALLAAAIVGFGVWSGWFAFLAGPAASGAQVWRWLTHPFVHSDKGVIWFLLDMIFLYLWGSRIERAFGRKMFAFLYLVLVLAPPLVTWLWFSAAGTPSLLQGTRLTHFPLFLAFCFMEPTTPFFAPHPALQAKYVGTAFFALSVVMLLGERETGVLVAFLVNCALTYFILRRNGLPPRFSAFSEAFVAALPKRPNFKKKQPSRGPLRVSPKSSASSPAAAPAGRYYEPKIKPRPDLYPEKQAVREVDDLLDKIARSGLDSLTPDERAKLEQASARLKNSD